MIEHITDSMQDCLITDEIFKTLMRQFAIFNIWIDFIIYSFLKYASI